MFPNCLYATHAGASWQTCSFSFTTSVVTNYASNFGGRLMLGPTAKKGGNCPLYSCELVIWSCGVPSAQCSSCLGHLLFLFATSRFVALTPFTTTAFPVGGSEIPATAVSLRALASSDPLTVSATPFLRDGVRQTYSVPALVASHTCLFWRLRVCASLRSEATSTQRQCPHLCICTCDRCAFDLCTADGARVSVPKPF